MKFKKYIVFCWEQELKKGGMQDIIGSNDDINICKEIFSNRFWYDYCQIVDRDSWEVVLFGRMHIDGGYSSHTKKYRSCWHQKHFGYYDIKKEDQGDLSFSE